MNLSKKTLRLCCFLLLILSQPTISQTNLSCDVYGNASSPVDMANTLFKLNNTIGEYNGCGLEPAIMVAIIDTNCQLLGTKYGSENTSNDFGNSNSDGGCRSRVEHHFTFHQNSSEELDSLEALLDNKIPDGYDVLVYSWRYLDSTAVITNAPTLISTFNEIGWSDFGSQDMVPFILYGKMGNTTSFQ